MNVFLSISTQDWLDTLVSAIVLGALVLTVEWVRWLTGWTVETTRRIAHVGTGVLVFFAPLIIPSPIPAIVLGSLFTILNYVAVRRVWFRSMHGTARPTYGTVYYPLAFTILSATCWTDNKPALMIGMAVMAVADVAAAWVGNAVHRPHRYNLGGDPKSVEGSVAMFVVSFLVILASFGYLSSIGIFDGSLTSVWILALVASSLAVVAEGLSVRGSDNLTIPLTVALSIHLMVSGGDGLFDHFVLGTVLALVISVLSYRFRFLDAGGAAATYVLGSVIFGMGGWPWAVPILVFFVTSSLWSKLGRKRKHEFDLIFDKGSTRDAGQVIANGALAGGVVLISFFWPSQVWTAVYLGIVAAVTADTWATEIGIYFKRIPVGILTFRRVEPGTSGGVTWPGTLGGFAGAVVIAASTRMVPWAAEGLPGIIPVAVAGLTASMVDSVLGATVQGQYVCPSCGRHTEKKRHCDGATTRIRGAEWITNDAVNWMCGLTGGLIMALAFYFSD